MAREVNGKVLGFPAPCLYSILRTNRLQEHVDSEPVDICEVNAAY